MTPERRREVASAAGKAAHRKGTAFEWSSAEAAFAGRQGGLARAKQLRHRKPATAVDSIFNEWQMGMKEKDVSPSQCGAYSERGYGTPPGSGCGRPLGHNGNHSDKETT